MSYGGAAVRRSPKALTVQPAQLDLRHVSTVIEGSEAGRVGVSVHASDVYGNASGAKLVNAAVLGVSSVALTSRCAASKATAIVAATITATVAHFAARASHTCWTCRRTGCSVDYAPLV